jgi:hypothetical protein
MPQWNLFKKESAIKIKNSQKAPQHHRGDKYHDIELSDASRKPKQDDNAAACCSCCSGEDNAREEDTDRPGEMLQQAPSGYRTADQPVSVHVKEEATATQINVSRFLCERYKPRMDPFVQSAALRARWCVPCDFRVASDTMYEGSFGHSISSPFRMDSPFQQSARSRYRATAAKL